VGPWIQSRPETQGKGNLTATEVASNPIAKVIRRALSVLPHGRQLSQEDWDQRHRAILVVLWLQIIGLVAFGFWRGYDWQHLAVDGGAVTLFAAWATQPLGGRRLRSSVASVGLLTGAALGVHLSGGVIEAHFMYFVVIALLMLYQDWIPFLVAIAYVVGEHGLIGLLLPTSVYNHAAARKDPWLWAGIHGAFVLAASAANLAYWRLSETEHARAMFMLVKDISQRKQAERQLRVSEERFRALAASAPVGIFRTDAQGRCTYVNRAWSAMTGLSAEEAIGDGWVQAVHPGDRDEVVSGWAQATAAGKDYSVRFRVRIPEGGVLWVDARAVAFQSDDDIDAGVVGGFIGTTTDVSAQVEAEAAIAAARDQAIEAARLKSDFLANMSHEIRTPMNAVIGMTGLLLDTPLNDEQHEYAGAVRSAGEALMQIINDILDFSKIEAGKLRLEQMDFDLRTVVEEVADLLAARAHEKGLELATLVYPDAPPFVRGDSGRLRQILTNLVGNAIKFTDRGEVVIRVRATKENPEAMNLRFEVSDTGIGISPAGRRRLFQAFEQVDSSAARKHGGTGLGLVISKQLVEMMGGEIGLESTLGTGSTFWFGVPLPSANSANVAIGPDRDLNGLRVLVVDDSATNRTILEHQLTSWGMLPTLAERGDEALTLLREADASGQAFDVAILDFNMPEMDGLSLATTISADPHLRRTRLVMLTSSGKRGDAVLGRRAGLSAYLPKPVHESQLYGCLAGVMGRVTEHPGELVTRHSLREEKARRGARLLVAEDNPVNQLVAVRMLEKLGYRADGVANGSEAVDALMRINYAAVLMDCQMPELDGFEATREIRHRQSSPQRTPVIAMTAGAMQSDRERCLDAGMDDYISKPVRLEELGAVLSRWVPAALPRDPDPSKAPAPDPSR
jgi:PAS domain S-box-containing protein